MCVDAAAVGLADGGDGLIMHWDEGVVDDPGPGVAGEIGLEGLFQHRDQAMDDPVDRRLTSETARARARVERVGAQVISTSSTRTASGWLHDQPGAGGRR